VETIKLTYFLSHVLNEQPIIKGFILLINSVSIIAGNYLFFGCRNKDKDFYFCDEWRILETKSLLSVFAAFSRDQVISR